MKVFFEFGSQPALSFAELEAILGRIGIEHEVVDVTRSGAAVEAELEDEEMHRLQAELGGVVRIAEFLGEGAGRGGGEMAKRAADLILGFLMKNVAEGEKVVFGLGFLGKSGGEGQERRGRGGRFVDLREIGIEVKKRFREKRAGKVRFVLPRQGLRLNAASVLKNGLVDDGFEFLIVEAGGGPEDGRLDRGKLLVSRTRTIQDFRAYSSRDYGRPRRSMEVGMLPPKVAQMMINLAGARRGAKVYDPFCGMGTVLAEALILGYRVAGSDVSKENVAATKANIDWLRGSFGVEAGLYDPELVFRADAREVGGHQLFRRARPDFVVSEPFLGKRLKKSPAPDKAKRIFEELRPLYLAYFGQMREVLGEGGRVVSVLPFFETRGGRAFWPYLDEILELGYTHVGPELGGFKSVFQKDLSPNGNLVYLRKGQFVGREIVILEIK